MGVAEDELPVHVDGTTAGPQVASLDPGDSVE
jgi:hypothetical protein